MFERLCKSGSGNVIDAMILAAHANKGHL
jgi:hypothetical protein